MAAFLSGVNVSTYVWPAAMCLQATTICFYKRQLYVSTGDNYRDLAFFVNVLGSFHPIDCVTNFGAI